MKTYLNGLVRKIILGINRIQLFILLQCFLVATLTTDSISYIIVFSIYVWLVYSLFIIYQIALLASSKHVSSKRSYPFFNFIYFTLYSIISACLEIYRPVYPFKGWFLIITSAYYLYSLIRSLGDIGKCVLSIEKRRPVKLEESIGVSILSFLYFFGVPILHTRIQHAINEKKLTQ